MMERRVFLGGGLAYALFPSRAAACAAGESGCVPKFSNPLRGGKQVILQYRPTICLSDRGYRLMTEDARGRKTTEARWDYAFWQGGRNAPYDIGTVVTGQCFNHQMVKHGTVIINWFNCREIINGRWTGRWVRYWSATEPVTSNGVYVLTIYHREYVEGFNSKPPAHARWPLPK